MKEDDTVTNATTATMYNLPNVPLKLLFFGTLNYDAVFTIGEPNTQVTTGHNNKAYKYAEEVPINIYAVDKTGLTATKLLWQCECELRRIAELYSNATGTLRVLRRTKPNQQYLGGFFLYSVECVLSYMRPAAQAQTTATVSYYNAFLDDFDNGIYGSTVYTATSNGAAGGTTIVNTTHTEANDFWNGRTVKMLTGTCLGEVQKITDFDAGTDTLTVDAFTAQIDSGDTYLIGNWQETEDGNTATLDVESDDWLDITVSASAGNKVCYYSYPSEATNHTSNLSISTTVYTKIRWRAICSDTSIKARIDLVFSDASTQSVLAATNYQGWVVGSATITTAKTLDHIRLYATFATGTVYFDFIQVYKGDFIFPNIVGVNGNFNPRLAIIPIPGKGGSDTQGLGTEDAEFDVTCDLSISNDYNDWKRPQGILDKTGYDCKDGQVFWEIVHRSYIDPWVWIDTETEQFKCNIGIPREDQMSDVHTVTLHVTEYRKASANSEYVYQRFGNDQ